LNDVSTAGSRSAGTRSGLLLGTIAVVFWSFGSTLIFLGAQECGTWPFVALASLTAGLLLMLARRLLNGELATAVWLPWRLWLAPLSCFVIYGLVWPWALASSTSRQIFGVNLINYLWPVLTVLLSAWWVPGVRLNGRILIALSLAMAGLVTANLHQIQQFSSAGIAPEGHWNRHLLPYALACAAAITWAVYSALMARWRDWAKQYVTSPLGFLLLGLTGTLIIAVTRRSFPAFTGPGTIFTLIYGAGPLAVGYLLWEIALTRARVQTLSLIAAATPILSTFVLCACLRRMPGPELVLAAVLVSAGVGLSVKG
jgi:drug/metabolite transporter (DMT)-like permease